MSIEQTGHTLVDIHWHSIKVAVINLLEENEKLRKENERLRSGDLTEQELNNLCHNLKVDGRPVTQELVCRFKQNCEEYQKKLFGGLA